MTEAFQEVGKGRSFGVVLLFLYEYGFEGIWCKKPDLFFVSTRQARHCCGHSFPHGEADQQIMITPGNRM